MYERACAAIEIEPLPDHLCDITGVFGPMEYPIEKVMSATLARRRWRGVEIETAQRDRDALARATEVAGGDSPYSREQYEAACAAAGIAPRSDGGCCGLWEAYLANQYGPVKVIGWPTSKDTAVILASRRADGVQRETADRVCDKCGTWLAPGRAMSASLGLACPDCYDDLSR